jgi:hypothetical protein
MIALLFGTVFIQRGDSWASCGGVGNGVFVEQWLSELCRNSP